MEQRDNKIIKRELRRIKKYGADADKIAQSPLATAENLKALADGLQELQKVGAKLDRHEKYRALIHRIMKWIGLTHCEICPCSLEAVRK